MFSLEPSNITKAVLLARNSEELYMSHYLGINPGPGLFRSPLRDDPNPTCDFYRSKSGELIFKDFRGDFVGGFVDVVMFIHKVNYGEALNIIANDFGIISRDKYTKTPPRIEYDGSKFVDEGTTSIQCTIKDFTKSELEWWQGFGITQQLLNDYRVFSVEHVFLNGNYYTSTELKSPIYGYYFGKKDSIEQWKIYFPFRKNNRFLLNTDSLQGFKQLPRNDKVLVVTKSLKDVMTLRALGISAIAPQTETKVLSNQQFQALQDRFQYIITNGDWDPAGIRFMANSRRTHETICLSFKDKKKYGKDISDFVKLHGIKEAKSLILELKRKLTAGFFDYQLLYS